MTEPMTDERLARLAADNEPVGDHLSGLTADEVAELVAEVKRARSVEAKLRKANYDLAKHDLASMNRASAAENVVAELQAQTKDDAGWTATENAEFEKLYGVQAAMRLRVANDRVWQIVKELRTAAVEDGRDPYQDPMAQRLSAALVGEGKAADDGD